MSVKEELLKAIIAEFDSVPEDEDSIGIFEEMCRWDLK